jgi:hypothetical protein
MNFSSILNLLGSYKLQFYINRIQINYNIKKRINLILILILHKSNNCSNSSLTNPPFPLIHIFHTFFNKPQQVKCV